MTSPTAPPATDDPLVQVPPDERDALGDATRQQALSTMRRAGFLQMNQALAPEFARTLQDAYAERYGRLRGADIRASSLRVGGKRYQITVEMTGAFNDPRIYANPCVFPVVNELLGNTSIIVSFGAVCAYPGAKAQHSHTDHPALFPEFTLTPLLPCHAITVAIPLVDRNPAAGTTAVWLGTHRETAPEWPERGNYQNAHIPDTRLGDIYMMDYRLVHSGTPNTSDQPRPMLYIVYARPWFTDFRNYRMQQKMLIPRVELDAVPELFRPLFSQALVV